MSHQMTASKEIRRTFPLHKVVEYKNFYKIQILLPETKDINRKNEKGCTVLHIACEQDKNEEILSLLLSHKDIDVTLKNKDGFNALHCLAFRGNLTGIVKILEKWPQINIDEETDKKNTPLIMASKMNHVDVIKYLVSKGANVKHCNDKNYTALHYAANNGYTECAEVLLDLGADINAKDDYGLTPLIKACKWGFFDTCDILLKNGAKVNYSPNYYTTALSSACYKDNVKVAKMLLNHGAYVNFPGLFSSAFLESAKRGSLKCATLLIKEGVLATGKKRNGKSAIELARENKHDEIVNLIQNLKLKD